MEPAQKTKKANILKVQCESIQNELKKITPSLGLGEAEKIITLFQSQVDGEPVATFKSWLKSNNLENLKEINHVFQSSGAGNTETKLRNAAHLFLGDVLVKLSKTTDDNKKVLDMAKSVVEWGWARTCETDSAFNFTQFKKNWTRSLHSRRGKCRQVPKWTTPLPKMDCHNRYGQKPTNLSNTLCD